MKPTSASAPGTPLTAWLEASRIIASREFSLTPGIARATSRELAIGPVGPGLSSTSMDEVAPGATAAASTASEPEALTSSRSPIGRWLRLTILPTTWPFTTRSWASMGRDSCGW